MERPPGEYKYVWIQEGWDDDTVLEMLHKKWAMPVKPVDYVPQELHKRSRQDRYFVAISALAKNAPEHLDMACREFANAHIMLWGEQNDSPHLAYTGAVMKLMLETIEKQRSVWEAEQREGMSFRDTDASAQSSRQRGPPIRRQVSQAALPALIAEVEAIEAWRETVPPIGSSSVNSAKLPLNSGVSRFTDTSFESRSTSYLTSRGRQVQPFAKRSPSVESASSTRSSKTKESQAAKKTLQNFPKQGFKAGVYHSLDSRSMSEQSTATGGRSVSETSTTESLKRKEATSGTTAPRKAPKKARNSTSKGKENASKSSSKPLPVMTPDRLKIEPSDFDLEPSPKKSVRSDSINTVDTTAPTSFNTQTTHLTSFTSIATSSVDKRASMATTSRTSFRGSFAESVTDEDTDADGDSFIVRESARCMPPPPAKPEISNKSTIRAERVEKTTPSGQLIKEEREFITSTIHASPSEPEKISRSEQREMATVEQQVSIYEHKLHIVYEMTRVALKNGCLLDEQGLERVLSPYSHKLFQAFNDEIDCHDAFWNVIKDFVPKSSEFERTKADTWNRLHKKLYGDEKETWDNSLVFSGEVVWVRKPVAESENGKCSWTLSLDLKPLCRGESKSRRYIRKFGADRFMTLYLPSYKSPPGTMSKNDAQGIIQRFQDLGFPAFGRHWKPFYYREAGRKKISSKLQPVAIIFFAESGPRMPTISVEEVMEWHIESESNLGMTLAKFCSRFQLGFSRSTPTVKFLKLGQIKFVKDFLSPWSTEKKKIPMDDGCQVCSPAVLRKVAEYLHLDYMPTAIQARIGGAKGVWFLDPKADPSSDDEWIQVNESQLKFERHKQDELEPDEDRVTLDVLAVSHELHYGSMNMQFVPILEEGGVPRDKIAELLAEDIKRAIGELLRRIDEPVYVKYWLELTKVLAARKDSTDIQWKGDLPANYAERAIYLLDAGFTMSNNPYLRKLVRDVIKDYCDTLKEKLHIEVPRSVQLMCIADPTGTLKEGEIFLRMSKGFTDETTKHNVSQILGPVLVGRNPAHLASDIQKVVAVNCPALHMLTDVVVFSTQGERPLADYLAGGDYDGDKPWVCWDSRIVEPFQNSKTPKSDYCRSEYFTKDETTVGAFKKQHGDKWARELIKYCLKHASGESKIGIATTYHRNLTYRLNDINCIPAVTLAKFIGALLDASKGGLQLREDKWGQVQKLYSKYPEPWYKTRGPEPERLEAHIVDYLKKDAYFRIDEIFKQFKTKFEKTKDEDNDKYLIDRYDEIKTRWEKLKQSLTAERSGTTLTRDQEHQLKGATEILRVLYSLNTSIHEIHERWKGVAGFSSDNPEIEEQNKEKKIQCRRKCFEMYQNLVPEPARGNTLVDEWERTACEKHSIWRQLKALALYKSIRFPDSSFIWTLAGQDLAYVKSHEPGVLVRLVTEDMYLASKVSKRMVKEVEAEFEDWANVDDELDNFDT